MIRIECPTCKKDSYTASVEVFRPCPYCGNLFSGKYGPLKKEHLESNISIHPFISDQGKIISANTQWFPKKEIGVKESTKISVTV